jgi:hypothetical protein
MGRIRSIKPELPQSETLGSVSREARLLFILLFTLVDDEGRTRASSRLLASLLYPFDEDARDLMEEWLTALEGIGAIERYRVDDTDYLEIIKWKQHQKVDKPSRSKFPPRNRDDVVSLATFREASRDVVVGSGSGSGRDLDLDLEGMGRDLQKGKNPSATLRAAVDDPVRENLEVESKQEASKDPSVPDVGYADPRDELWAEGPVILETLGVDNDRKRRSMLGVWMKSTGDNADAVLLALRRAQEQQPQDPIPWITRVIAHSARGGQNARGYEGTKLAIDNLERKLRAGTSTPAHGGLPASDVPGRVPGAGGDGTLPLSARRRGEDH